MDAGVESGERAEDLVGWTVSALGHARVVSVQSRIDVGILGQEAPAILDVAEDFGADLIVMGSRGLTDLSGLLLVSVAHKVIHLASCPVLAVR
jgi:nucleotide-binding universal stress UspA family protein